MTGAEATFAHEPAGALPDGSADGGLHRKLVWLTLFRIATITVLLGGTAVVNVQFGAQAASVVAPLYAVVVATYATSLVFAVMLRVRALERGVAAAQIVLDVAVAAAVVATTGLTESVFVFMFLLAIVNGAILMHRAGAVGADYRTRFGHLPTRREVMTAVGVSESTATRALRQLKAEPDARQAGSAEADQSRIDTTPAVGNERPGITRGEPTPAADQEPTGRHRPRGAHLNDVRQPHAEGGVAAERSTDRHPVQVTGQATSVARRGHETGRARPNEIADVDTYATTAQADDRRGRERDRDTAPERSRPAGERLTDQAAQRAGHTADDAADRPPPAQVSIDRARAAVAVLVAHRAVQAQRQQVEHDHAERLTRWNADDQHRAHADTRSDAEGMCPQ